MVINIATVGDTSPTAVNKRPSCTLPPGSTRGHSKTGDGKCETKATEANDNLDIHRDVHTPVIIDKAIPPLVFSTQHDQS